MQQNQVATMSRRIATGISGFDELTDGGLPWGGLTVVFGSAGAGKTIFGMQVLAAGALTHDEHGIFVTFEESAEKIVDNTAGFIWGGSALQAGSVQVIDARLSDSIEQGGAFDLVALLGIVAAKAALVHAERVVFDGLDVLLGYLNHPVLIRREVFRIRDWAHAAGLSVILTAKADGAHRDPEYDSDFLQYIADCVVVLHHRVVQGVAMRSLRITKYRGAAHSANEFPFVISRAGVELAATTSSVVAHEASSERVSTGVERLDAMLSGGYYRGSSVLITGAPGTAKTSLSAAFALAASARGERTLYVSFDESPAQIVRNVGSIAMSLREHLASGLLVLHSLRARSASPAAHIAHIRTMLTEHRAQNLVIDPLSALQQRGAASEGEGAALELLDFAKTMGVTIVGTSLLGNTLPLNEQTPLNISTIADTWMHVSYVNQAGERNRALTIVKARGTRHSNQVREMILSDTGVTLADVYTAGGEVLMGTVRWEKEKQDRRAHAIHESGAKLREQKAALALAETNAKLETLNRARAIQQSELDDITDAKRLSRELDQQESDQLLQRRSADILDPDQGRSEARQ